LRARPLWQNQLWSAERQDENLVSSVAKWEADREM